MNDLDWIRHDLLTFPQPRSLILAARYVEEHDQNVPEWVRVLARGERMTAELVEMALIAHLDRETT